MSPRACVTVAAAAVASVAAAAGPARAAEQQAYAAGLAYTTPAVVAGKGDTLRFNNLDAAAQHDIDSDRADFFDSPLISAGESTLVRGVDKLAPGSYAFHCSIHSWMKGSLTVTEAGGAPGAPRPGDPGSGDGGDGGGPDPLTLAPRAAVEPLGEGSWPFYGKDGANSRDGRDAGPSYNEVPDLGPVWSHKSTDGDFTGTPVVSGGTLVMGSSGGTVFALDAATGKAKWKLDLVPEKEEENARITGSAALYRGRAYIPVNRVGRPALVALDLRTGKVKWRRTIDKQKRSDVYGSPTVSRNVVYVGTSGYFGEQVSGVDVSARGSIAAFNARTGRRKWKTYSVPPKHDGGAVWSTPAIDPKRKRLYIGTGNAYHQPAAGTTDSMLMLSTRTGRLVKHFQATAGDAWNGVEDSAENPDADFGASPNLLTLKDGRRVVGQGQKSGVYWLLDRTTMRPIWNATTGPGSFSGGIVGSTAYSGGRIFGPNTVTSQIWALELGGRLAWTSTDGSPLHFGAVSAANGVVYANDMAGFLTAREATTGLILAKLPLGSPSWAGVAIAGRSIFTATGTNAASGYIVSYRVRER